MKKHALILILSIIFQQCDSYSCEDVANMYRNVEFAMKVEKISNRGSRHLRIEGKNKDGIHESWKDFSSWLIEINQIGIGDSIIKPKGKAFLLLKKTNDTTYTKYFYECQGKKYN